MRNLPDLSRRKFLKIAGINCTLGLAAGISGWPYTFGKGSTLQVKSVSDPHFATVRVSPDRIIRTVVGFRPFRPSGFVLKSEKINNKLIVHDYGHGGGGFSLSWGTATFAVEKAIKSGISDIAVAGCGVIGLTTALLLQRKGFKVIIYSKELPPETTSNIAVALWSPGSVYETNAGGNEFLNQFYMASKISHRIFQDYVGDKYGVRWIRNYSLGGAFHFPGGKELYPGFKVHENADSYFGYPHVEEIMTMLIEPPVYLNALLEDFYLAGGKTEIKTFNSPQDLKKLHENVIMNCTGLGAGRLFNDNELIPAKGQLNILLPQEEIDYSYVSHSENNLLYMFPRKDGIILGGTFERGDWSTEPDDQESARILKGHTMIADSLRTV